MTTSAAPAITTDKIEKIIIILPMLLLLTCTAHLSKIFSAISDGVNSDIPEIVMNFDSLPVEMVI